MMAPTRKSQSILISGESGAGKTESTKIVMLYLTTLGTAASKKNEATSTSSSGGGGGDMSIMEKVLQSNPILEAFGNARTLRNDNSSRFGKFIELGFSRSGTLVGAKVQTYLLEKVRLGFHASGERNYHMFYQLLRGANDVQKQKYQFHDGDTHGLELANYYHYTGQGGAPSLREFTDEEGFQYTLKAMSSLGWSEDKIDTVLSLVAGLLHLGQMTFDAVENEAGQDIAKVADESILQNAATLLGVDLDKLKAALTERILITRGEQIKIDLEPAQAADSRDALTKTMYGALFLWVVSQVNESIIWKNDSEVRSSTGVLDIFGFECFAINSFEQLCINFTNEALQQQFNKFIFKMEQAEYESEEIRWDFISFPDNQDCLDTIQSKPHGLLAMLDDECRLGARGNDRNWADRLYKHYIPNKNQTESDNTRFSATLVEKGRSIFTVRHFAGPVKYTATTGFLEKNKDEIPETAKNLFHSSQSWLIRDIYAVQMKETEESAPQSGKAAKSKTVSQQFKMQLVQLMEKVESTEPHYIRCLKPNDAAKPNLLTRRRLTEQLRYGGVLEAVRVARMGFPVRLNHDLFFQEYRLLLPSVPDEKLPWSLSGGNAQALCIKLVDILLEEGKKSHAAGEKLPHEEGISRSEKIRRMQTQPIPMVFPKTDVQLGKSKVFMRKPAHDALEAHRVFHQTAAATILQAWLRGMQKRVKFLILCDATETAQRFYRGCKGRERYVPLLFFFS
jgi:myosin-5